MNTSSPVVQDVAGGIHVQELVKQERLAAFHTDIVSMWVVGHGAVAHAKVSHIRDLRAVRP